MRGIEERMDDVRAVMDAAGSDRAALFGSSEGGPMSILFAATFPDRVNALVLAATFATYVETPDYPCGAPLSFVETFSRLFEERWGTGGLLDDWAPGLARSERAVASIARWERMSEARAPLWRFFASWPRSTYARYCPASKCRR